MSIPTMAIGCSMAQSKAGPGLVESLKDVTEAIESLVVSPPNLPTHLGLGVRFGLSHTGGTIEEPGASLDVECRIDLLSIELGSTGDPPPRPMPAIHINAHLGQEGFDNEELYLHGGPGESTRLRSIDLDVSWNRDDTGSNQWDASLSLNDAALSDHVDWSSAVPGCLQIGLDGWGVGASEVIDAFLGGYANTSGHEAVNTFLSGMNILGLANQTPVINPDPGAQDIRWHLDQPALQTFIDTPCDYIEDLLQDPNGNWDLGQPLPSTGAPLGEHIASFLPHASWNTGSEILSGGRLDISLPISSLSSGVSLSLDRFGDFSVGLEPLELGPAALSAIISLDAFNPSSWVDGPNIDIRIDMVEDVTGILEGASLVFSRNSPWSATLELPTATRVPIFSSSGIIFDNVGPVFDLLNPSERSVLLSAVPGMVLDAALQIMVERLLLQRVDLNGDFSTILTVLGVASRNYNGVLSANSLIPWIDAPLSHLSSCLLTSNGLNVPALLTLGNALLGLMGLELDSTVTEVIDPDAVDGQTPELMVTALHASLGPLGGEVLLVTLKENESSPCSFSIIVEPHPDSGILGGARISLDGQVRVNIANNLSVDIDGTKLTLDLNIGNMIQSITPASGSSLSQQDNFFNGIISAFSNAEALIQMEMVGGSPTLQVDVDFDTTDPTVPACVLNLYPVTSGIDTFLREIASSAITAVLPEMIEYGITQLNGINVAGTTLGGLIQGILTDLDVWTTSGSGGIDLSAFNDLCTNPADYLRGGNRIADLIARASSLILGLIPQGSGSPLLLIVANSDGSKNWTNIRLNSPNTWLSGFSLDIGDKLVDEEYGFWLGYTHTISPIKEINSITPGSGYTDGLYRDVVITGDQSNSDSARATVGVSSGEVISVVVTHSGSGYLPTDSLATLTGGSLEGAASPTPLSTSGTVTSVELSVMRFNIHGEIGFSRDSSDVWNLNAVLSAHFMDRLISSPFEIQPAIRMDLTDDQFGLIISSGVDTAVSNSDNSPASNSSDCFWIRLFPLDQFEYGIPDLSAMLVGAANTALDFIENLDTVQEFLSTPLYNPGSGAQPWEQNLSKLTILGDWLVHLGICSYDTSASTLPSPSLDDDSWKGGPRPDPLPASASGVPFNFRTMNDIIGHYSKSLASGSKYPYPSTATNVFDVLLRGVMDMISATVSGTVPIYTRTGSDFDFSISLDIKSNPMIIGINFDFLDDLEIPLGNLMLVIFTRDPDNDPEYNRWDTKAQSYTPGVTLQLLSYDPNSTKPLEDHFSLEFGHLAFELRKKDRQPILDGFLLLNSVSITVCIDMTFDGGFTIEAGGRLDLDDFGLSLGGNGSEDGGNSLAAGTLDGGEGKEAVRPTFDLAIWKYGSNSVDVEIRGGLEYWFPINKQFGPIKISQIGVRYEPVDDDGDEHRLSILIDGEAEIAGFLAQVDDLSVSMPILDLFNFSDWKYDMAGCAISYTGPAIEIAGALRKTVITDTSGNEYIEYQGLCTIKTSTMAISAIGAFGRVPVPGGDSYVTCFVIAALDMPLGGPPMFFVTGLLGGLGLNRELYVPDISQVPSSPFMLAMDGFGSDPMGALESIRTHLPAERGSLWFAIGVKFTTFQVIESKAVLYIKISNDDFAVGLIGLSAMSLPTPEFNIGYIELAFSAGYDSGANIFFARAQLTDASYLFSKSCRLTGGFALMNWFNRGDFLLSIGGYHPKFKVPSHYPAVPRLGFNWKPMSKLVIKGGAYFTVCSSAVMLGGSFEASFKSGSLSASFRAGVDVLIVFDPFFYSFRIYIGVSVRLKTWLGTLKASLGADLEIEGPKMRGTARIEIVFVSFTVKFGSNQKGSPQPISGKEFMNKHILQRPEDEFNHSFSNLFEEQFALAQPVKGLIRSSDGDSPDEDEAVNGPFNLEMEFEFAFSHLFPSEGHTALIGDDDDDIDHKWREPVDMPSETFDIAPCHIDDDTNGAPFTIEILKDNQPVDINDYHPSGLSYVSTIGHFASTLWTCDMDSNNRPKASTSVPENQPRYLNGGSLIGRSTPIPSAWLGTINMDQVEKSVFVHNLPLQKWVFSPGLDVIDIFSKINGATKVALPTDSRETSPSSTTRDSGIKSYSMGMLASVLDGAKTKHEVNRKALDTHSGVSIRTETIRTTKSASNTMKRRVVKK